MKERMKLWMLAAILTCGFSFISCTDDDDNPAVTPDEPQQQLADYTIIWYGHGGGNLDFFLMQNVAQLYMADEESYTGYNPFDRRKRK